MAIEIVDLPIKNGGSFHSYVNVYQRVKQWGFTLFFFQQKWGFEWDLTHEKMSISQGKMWFSLEKHAFHQVKSFKQQDTTPLIQEIGELWNYAATLGELSRTKRCCQFSQCSQSLEDGR